MKDLYLRKLHVLYFIISVLIFLIYLIKPNFLIYDLKLFLNIVLVIVLLLQLSQWIYIKRDKKSNVELNIRKLLDFIVPIITLYIGVSSL